MADLKIRRLCRPCNQGWLARLEEETKHLVSPGILGRGPLTFSAADRKTVARWSLKTAALLGYTASPPQPAPAGYFRWLMQNDSPPLQTGVWVAAYGGAEQSITGRTWTTNYTPIPSGPSFQSALTLLGFGPLLFLILEFHGAPETIAVGTHDAINDFVVKLWPSDDSHVRWPPKLGCDDDGVSKLFSAQENGLIQVFANIGTIKIE
jgi:hypothetical protein